MKTENIIMLVVVGLLAWMIMKAPATTTTTTPAGNQVVPATQQCAYAPTVQLGANDKYTSGQTNWGNWKYILNGGTSTTDSDGSFEVAKGDTLKVLIADSNSSTFYRSLWVTSIQKCGTQPIAYNEVIKVGGYSIKCYNDINQPINGTTYFANYANYSIGTGGSMTAKCELTTTAKTATPMESLIILEMNGTTYKENEIGLSFNGVAANKVTLPSAYSLGSATGKALAFEVPAFGGLTSQVIPMIITAQAESTIDPAAGYATTTSYADSIVGYVIPKNCYEEEDVTPSEFRCGYEDLDNTFMAPGGTAKTNAAIAVFAIPVQ